MTKIYCFAPNQHGIYVVADRKVTIRHPDGSLSYGETRKVRKNSNNLILAVAGWEQRGQYIERIIDDLLSFGDLKYPEEFAGSASVYLRA